MSSLIPIAPAVDLDTDQRWLLAQRVASSSGLRRSQRLQELLLFIARRALREPSRQIREQEIGMAVFGRPEGYDTAADNIVRVDMFQLRKRLKDYFENDGSSEPVIIEIPKGTYVPEFVVRPPSLRDLPEPPRATGISVVPTRDRAGNRTRLAAAAAAILLVGCGLGWLLHWLQTRTPASVAGDFWIQMFGNGKPTDLVVADCSLTFFQDMLQRNISLQEYQQRQWSKLQSSIVDPARRDLAASSMSHQYTNFSETVATYNLGVAAASNHLSLDVVFARDFSARHLENGNAILDGTPRANPWMKFFESGLNFQYDFDDSHPVGFFRNTHPRKGELDTYRVLWDRKGYCRVAYLANLSHTGTVLILAGTDLSSAEAGARFITSNDWISRLRERLKLKQSDRIPHFEVLLQADLAVAAAPRFDIAAIRLHE